LSLHTAWQALARIAASTKATATTEEVLEEEFGDLNIEEEIRKMKEEAAAAAAAARASGAGGAGAGAGGGGLGFLLADHE
jgi:uncharacterized membrane protein